MLPIPGTGSPDHLAENIRGASLELSQEDFEALEHAAK
jgi:aryl-alcohol dehydrogenase-like predicted oxidoreductase